MNYSVVVGNTMAEVLNTFAEGQAMTAELANATINANNSVTGEVVAGYQAQKDAEQARIDEMPANGVITQEEYNKRVRRRCCSGVGAM